MPVVKLTKSYIDKIPFVAKGKQNFYVDTSLEGFGLRVGAKTKSFYAQKRIKGKDKRITIGTYGQITLDQARREAQRLLGIMAMGKNPKEEEKQGKIIKITLLEVFQDYLKTRKSLKPGTVTDYHKIVNSYLSDWHDIPLADITKDMVANKHTKLGERSHAQANYAMRILRALFNFAKAQYEDENGDSLFLKNPVDRLSQTRAWYHIARRDTVIHPNDFPALFEGLEQLKEVSVNSRAETIRAYTFFLLFTGLRRTEAAKLKWEDVSFNNKTFKVLDTKNKEPLTLPMSDFLFDLLKKQHEKKTNDYVFPGKDEGSRIKDARSQMAKVTETSGVPFTSHDFRRTFMTIAVSLDISAYAVKKLVNHKMKGDVTAGYIILDVERLREPMQRISDYILEKAGILNQRSV